ncbi:ARC6/PARC6 family protein [Nostoc sp. 2RC]|uniref:ARC6/PARC6 family protein n=1 Tax=Nostoc sp. 2RC TaxID=2485484 RepID=UPI00162980B6|nr:ARC6/PARC6 family protein [Nostoc sp. 2RC]MBC1239864.1 ARC6/PARC6 family protein [Nostoc sp. 2RC]
MKKRIVYLTLLMISGCGSGITSTPVSSNCPEKPTNTLAEKDVQEVVLDEQTLSKSGQANASKSIGYEFAAKSGQKLSFSTDSDICVWLYAPDNQILKGGDLPQTGKYIMQVSALKGSKTFDMNMTLGVLQASANPTPTPSVTVTPNPFGLISTPTPTSTVTPRADLSQEQALSIVQEWYAAKPQIFGQSFDTSLVEKLTTGKLYEKTTNSDPEVGPIAWLKANNSYYKYNQFEIRRVTGFSNSGRRPYIRVKVFEELYLYGQKGNIDRENSGSFQNDIIYFFEKDNNGIWKIYDYSKT